MIMDHCSDSNKCYARMKTFLTTVDIVTFVHLFQLKTSDPCQRIVLIVCLSINRYKQSASTYHYYTIDTVIVHSTFEIEITCFQDLKLLKHLALNIILM